MVRDTSRSSGTKKASASKRSTAKKSITKKAPEKSSTKKAPAKKSADRSSGGGDAPRAESRPTARAGQVAARAAEELSELTGKGVEGVTGLERTDDGWTEVRRIPDTTDVLALYEVQTDRQGSMLGYRRVRRYARGVPGED
jgi:Gas vesicle synthesis protein GvpO